MSGREAAHGVPHWVKMFAIVTMALVPLMVVLHFIAVHLLGLASDDHGHRRHTPRADATEHGPHRP
ncbi:MAG: hypothetical protein K2X43_23510 [Hyphomonadaceae bacterium]|nr:hypothetical protein [Hyphomonadaceae bacterium]